LEGAKEKPFFFEKKKQKTFARFSRQRRLFVPFLENDQSVTAMRCRRQGPSPRSYVKWLCLRVFVQAGRLFFLIRFIKKN
jgi:hypothetical protein